MRRLAVALVLCAWAAPGRAADVVPARFARWLAADADVRVARVVVPSEEQRVGEVRLLRRGGADVVQTLLSTKVLSRVVGEIRKKELANWPPGRPGHDDALRYLAALDAAREAIWNRLPADVASADRRQKLWIEFVLGPEVAFVALGRFEGSDEGGEIAVTAREPLAVLEPTRDYVAADMRLIAADSFHVEGAALDSLLAPLARLRPAEPR